MTFERGIWKESARNFWANKWVALTAVGLITAVSLFQDYTHSKSSGGIWVEFAWLPVAIAAHATILNGTTGFNTMGGSQYKTVFSPFLWRSMGLSLIGIIPAAAITIPLAGPANKTVFIYLFTAIYAATESFILAKWGTMLPACVANGDRTFKTAGTRGIKIFRYVLGRFWACNAVVLVGGFAGLIAAYVAVATISDDVLKLANHDLLQPLLQVSLFTLFAFNLVMLATILSRAYLIAENKT